MKNKFATLIIDIRKAAFLCIIMGLLVGTGILTVFLMSTERSPFLLEAIMPTGVYKRQLKTCSIEGCNGKHYGKGLCEKHYRKKYHKEHKEYFVEHKKQWEIENKEHIAKYTKQYYQDHNEEAKQYNQGRKKERAEYNRKYRQDNKEVIAKGMKQWYQENKDQIREQHKQWQQTLAGKASGKAASIRYKTQDKDFTKEIILRVYEANIKKYGTLTCYLCSKPIVNNDDCIDHSTPIIRDGGNNIENLGIAHRSCNAKKSTMTLKEWKNKKRIINNGMS